MPEYSCAKPPPCLARVQRNRHRTIYLIHNGNGKRGAIFVWRWRLFAPFSASFGVYFSRATRCFLPPIFPGGHLLKINWPVFRVPGAFLNEPSYSSKKDTI